MGQVALPYTDILKKNEIHCSLSVLVSILNLLLNKTRMNPSEGGGADVRRLLMLWTKERRTCPSVFTARKQELPLQHSQST